MNKYEKSQKIVGESEILYPQFTLRSPFSLRSLQATVSAVPGGRPTFGSKTRISANFRVISCLFLVFSC